MLKIRPALLAVATAWLIMACDSDPAALDPAPARVEILLPADSLDFAASMNATANVRNEDDLILPDRMVTWSSSDPAVLSVDPLGRITALRAGAAYIRAGAAAVVDSVKIRVPERSCYPVGADVRNSRFGPASVRPGGLYGYHEPIRYADTQTLFGSGIVVSIGPETTLAGWYAGNGQSDFDGRVCKAPDDPTRHVITVLESGRNKPVIPGLRIVQDVFVYDRDQLDDFIVMRYEFSNERGTPIHDLAVGYVADLDVYDAVNVANFDPATGVMDAEAPDPAVRPVVAGVVIVDETITSYRSYDLTVTRETPQLMREFITGGMVGPNRRGPSDIRHAAGIAPFDLQPGEERVIWIALVGGENRPAFNQHVEQVKAWVRLVR